MDREEGWGESKERRVERGSGRERGGFGGGREEGGREGGRMRALRCAVRPKALTVGTLVHLYGIGGLISAAFHALRLARLLLLLIR
eukprot:scaffold155174_cov33-Tisochrysis_lutea.AAC.8